MSSALRSLSQIPVRSKFFIAIQDASGNELTESIVDGASWPYNGDSIVDVSQLGALTQVAATAGDIFRDLGRQILVVSGSAHVALYREAMPQKGVGSEGISSATFPNGSVWLRVWAADGSGVKVARLG
jgi:hypothetical protein